MTEYDDETLRHVQRLELMILTDFIDVCKRNSLRYFAYGGTGIGAFRHKGFIPWDDDIDVCLPAADYERLLQVFQDEYADSCLLYTSPSPRDLSTSRMPSSA